MWVHWGVVVFIVYNKIVTLGVLCVTGTSLLALIGVGCGAQTPAPRYEGSHGSYATGLYASLGGIMPVASDEQRAIFEKGREVSLRPFRAMDGLGPAFNVTFCSSCHEKPTAGGAAGLYRSFAMGGKTLSDGAFISGESAGDAQGIIRKYSNLHNADGGGHPALDETMNTIAQRNPIPFYGVGLLAELDNAELLKREDPDDQDGDGISGRANWDRGFVGRFGRKCQTVSIEGFIRGPLFNHMGITTNPLPNELKAKLPVDSGLAEAARLGAPLEVLHAFAQAAAPDGPLTDDCEGTDGEKNCDAVPDPEMSEDDLFALVSYVMLIAPPEPAALNAQTTHGRDLFNELGCPGCHTPRLNGPRGALPVYSDLLLHDMGPGLADGISAGLATGTEFRTQPLWGVGVVAPYLHDGRAQTLKEAILLHGGEAQSGRDAAALLSEPDMQDLVAFLESLGGMSQYTQGLLPPDAPVPPVGDLGGPRRELSSGEQEDFIAGRRVFDTDFGLKDGVGSPRFNGDSCRGCHFDPVIGGAGPLGVNAIRHGIINSEGHFVPPSVGTILHRQTSLMGQCNAPQVSTNVYELRQTPHVFGLGLVDAIDESVIVANADPDDTSPPDGISGRVSYVSGGRVGRLGWKAQVPSIAEFIRDAVSAELGMTLPWVEDATFGVLFDTDDVDDPEFSLNDAALLQHYLSLLAPPPRLPGSAQNPAVQHGETLFAEVGCAACHMSLQGADGPVPLYSDLLLHEILPENATGIEDASAGMRELRTTPLWGLSQTGPYLHDGSAETLSEAIAGHFGEGAASANAFSALDEEAKEALLAFLESL